MTTRRKIILGAAGAVVLALALLAAAPFLFRDRLMSRLQAEIEKNVAAQVTWRDVRISLLRDFPNVSFGLEELVVTGVDRFEGDTLAHVPRFQLVLELPSVVRALRGNEPLVVRSIRIDQPSLRLSVLEDGAANWDIQKGGDSSEAAGPPALSLKLRSFVLQDGSVSYDDRRTGVFASARGLRQSLRGDFRQARFRVDSRTGSESVSLRFAGVPYLSRVTLDVVAALDVDAEARRISVQRGELVMNDLRLALSGTTRLAPDSLELDLAFDAPGTELKELLSLLPVLYDEPTFADLRAGGTMAVAGWIRGGYGANAFPALAIEVGVEDGSFQYPELPLPARGVQAALSITNPGGDPDRTVVELKRARLEIGGEPVEASLTLRTPVSDPDIDLKASGKVDLSDLARTVKLSEVQEMAGVVALDAALRTRMSDVEHRRYERVAADGSLQVSNLELAASALPHRVEIAEARLRVSPRHAELSSFRGRVGNSDAEVTGRFDNLLGFGLRGEALSGRASVTSRLIDLDEWRSEDDEVQTILVPANLDLALNANVDRLAFGDLDLRNARGSLRVKDERATLEEFRLELLGGTMAVSGYYETSSPSRPTFDVGVRLTDLDVAQGFAGLETVRRFAPVARYARGRVSTELRMNGAMGIDMTPIFEVLSGQGSLSTAGLALHGFPGLERLADALQLEQLRQPTLADLRSTFRIERGRLHVSPFELRFGDIAMTVSGSHGIDETLDYALALQVPRAAFGGAANRALLAMTERATRAGLSLTPAETVDVGVALKGTLQNPQVSTELRESAAAVAQAVGSALREQADARLDALSARGDSVLAEARRNADAEARRIVVEAERQAERIRAEAAPLAELTRKEGYEQANALVERAPNPIARRAAEVAAERLRKEADQKAEQILQEADRRAEALVEDARRRSEAV